MSSPPSAGEAAVCEPGTSNTELHEAAGDKVLFLPANCADDKAGKSARRKNYNPWGAQVYELMHARELTLDKVAARMAARGFPAKHPKHALNRAMQRSNWKAITPLLQACIADVLQLNKREREELKEAHYQTGVWAMEFLR